MSHHSSIAYEDSICHPAVSPFLVTEHGAHEVFDQRPVPGYTHQLFGERSTPGRWNANLSCSTPTAAEAFPFAGVNGDRSAAPQMFDTSSCSNYEMQWSYCSTLPGRVLSVVMHQVKHPVPIDVLNHLFSVYGVVETIFQSLNQHGRMVLIQYQHGYMADNALQAAHGWYLYHTYCQLDIKHADPVELQILHDCSCALFSEIINDADHLSHESTAMPQNEVSDCSQLVTLHMKGQTSEQQVQSNIPVFNVVIIGTHEQKQHGGKHDASTVPKERVIEQPTLMQVLDELPSFHAPKVAVQLCSAEVVQAATAVGQGNPASSTPLVMHVDDPQLPTRVQDASDLFEEMPVFDVYEEDTNGSLNFVIELCDTGVQHKQYDSEKPIYDHEEPHGAKKLSSQESDNERLAVCFNTTSDNAFSEESTNFTFLHGPVIHADRSITLTTEKSTQAASILCVHEAIVNRHDERSEIHIKKQEVLINKHDMISPCDLNTDKVSLSSAPCMWDPGIDLFSHKKLHIFPWIPNSAIIILQQENFFFPEKGRQVQWDPGIQVMNDRTTSNSTWTIRDAGWLKTTEDCCAEQELMANTSSKVAALTWHNSLSRTPFIRLSSTIYTWDPGILCIIDRLLDKSTVSNQVQYVHQIRHHASYVWDPGTMLLWYKFNWWLFTEEKEMGRLIPEQWIFWCNVMNYRQIFQRRTTVSSLFHYHGIPLWLINFQVP